MASAATRRKIRRQRERERLDRGREAWADDEFGLDLRTAETNPPWRGGGQARLAWVVDQDPFVALLALGRARSMLDGVQLVLVEELRELGVSWADIGWALEQTGEAVRKRYAGRVG